MTTPSKEAREAAADWLTKEWDHQSITGLETIQGIRAGRLDNISIVQAFHRFQLEERERCAEVVEARVFHSDYPYDSETLDRAATAIRQQGEEK